MIESSEDFDLILDSSCLVSSKLSLIEKFNGYFKTRIGDIVTEKDLAELTRPKDL